jgi:nucleotide-binding universal stress UspA family protein
MVKIANILVATDFSEAADSALEYARTFARDFGSNLHVLHVAENLLARQYGSDTYVGDLTRFQTELEESARKRINDRLGPKAADARWLQGVVVTADSPAEAIVEYAKDANIDLIVMGTHGRSGLPRLLLGSVAERVLRTANCPVMTVHQPEHLP